MDACGLSCQWLPTSLARHPQAHSGGICVLFHGSVLLLLQTLPLSHPSSLWCPDTLVFMHVLWLVLLPQPEHVCPCPLLLIFCFFWPIAFINKLFRIFYFLLLLLTLREVVEEELHALPWSMFLSALRRHGSPSTSGAVGLGHTETGFQRAWIPVTGV